MPASFNASQTFTALGFQAKGMEFVGRDTTNERMEVFEVKNHPFYIGAQYHPEFKSRPLKPSPLFYGLICASAGLKPEPMKPFGRADA